MNSSNGTTAGPLGWVTILVTAFLRCPQIATPPPPSDSDYSDYYNNYYYDYGPNYPSYSRDYPGPRFKAGRIRLDDNQTTTVTTNTWTRRIPSDDDETNPGLIAVVVILSLLTIAIIIGIIYARHRRRLRPNPSTNTPPLSTATPPADHEPPLTSTIHLQHLQDETNDEPPQPHDSRSSNSAPTTLPTNTDPSPVSRDEYNHTAHPLASRPSSLASLPV